MLSGFFVLQAGNPRNAGGNGGEEFMTKFFEKFVRFDAPKGTEGGDPPAGDPAPGSEGTPPNGTGTAGLSQEEVNRIAGERAKRAEETTRKQLWDALGIKNQDEWNAYLKAKKEQEDANKTELERLAEEAKNEKARADSLEAEKKTEAETLQKRIVDGEIKLLASQPVLDKDGKVTRAAFRPEALMDVALLIDRTEIKDEDGKLTGIDKALDALAKAKPYLLAEQTSTTKGPGTPPGGGNPPKPSKPAGTEEPKRSTLRL